MSTKISIITASYNSGRFIERAIESVVSQNYPNFEHIIIDGKSTDDTLGILAKYPHLIVRSESDKGQSDAMNKGFTISTGEVVVYLNADDYFFENVFFEINEIYTRLKPDFIIGNLAIIENNITRIDYSQSNPHKILHPSLFGFPYNPVCYFYRREVQVEVGKFPLHEHYAMDYWFLIRALQNRKIYKSSSVFGCFYLHENNKTMTENSVDLMKIVDDYLVNKGVRYKIIYFLRKALFVSDFTLKKIWHRLFPSL